MKDPGQDVPFDESGPRITRSSRVLRARLQLGKLISFFFFFTSDSSYDGDNEMLFNLFHPVFLNNKSTHVPKCNLQDSLSLSACVCVWCLLPSVKLIRAPVRRDRRPPRLDCFKQLQTRGGASEFSDFAYPPFALMLLQGALKLASLQPGNYSYDVNTHCR